MAEDLIFIQTEEGYAAEFVSTGAKAVIQLQREQDSPVFIRAGLSGMPRQTIGVDDNTYGKGAVFAVDVPKGVEVSIISTTPVTTAKILM